LARLCYPTLVLTGAHDPVLPLEGSEDLVVCLQPERMRFERLANGGHNLLMERPKRVLGTHGGVHPSGRRHRI